MKRRSRLSPVVAGALCALLLPSVSGSTGSAKSGGIFRVTFLTTPGNFDHVDPALAYSRESWALLDTVCARLMRYRDRPPPQGYQLVPEVAAAPPVVSRDGKTWTFRLRKGFRFSDGSPVRADAFAQAIHRTLAPGVDSPAYLYTQAIVGAEDVHAGRAARASGVTARGHTLTVRFTREVREFASVDDDAVLLRRPAGAPAQPGGRAHLPGRRPLHHPGVPAQRTHRPRPQPLLRRPARPPRRRLPRRPQRRVAGREDQTRRHRQGGLDLHAPGGRPPAVPRSDRQVRPQLLAVLHHPRLHHLDVRPQLLRPALPEQPTRYDGRSTSPSTGDDSCGPGAGDATDQYLPPNVPGFRQRTIYPARGPRPRTGAGGRESPRRQGPALRSRRPARARLRSGGPAPAGGDRARDRDPALRGTRDRVVLPRAARQRRRAMGPGARALDAGLRRPRRLHQPPARQAARRRHEPCPLRRATVQRADAAGVAPARRSPQPRPTPSSTCDSPATPRRSCRSPSSTRRRWFRHACRKGACCCARASCSRRSASSSDAASPGTCLPGRAEPARGRSAPRCAGFDGCAGGRDLPGQLPGLEQPAGVRSRRPGARLHPRELGAARHGLRAADALPRRAAACGLPARAGGRGRAADRLARTAEPGRSGSATGFRFSDGRPVRADAFAQAIHRTMAPGVDSPAYAVHAARSSAPRTSTPAERRARPASIARGKTLDRPLHPPVGDVRRLDDDAVLLRRPADAAARRGRRPPLPRRRPLRRPASTGPTSASRFAATATTAATASTTSTASTSTSTRTRRRRCSTESKRAGPTGVTRCLRLPSSPAGG